MTTPKRTTAESTPPWAQGPESAEFTFGTWLRQQREVREVSLREVAEASKISLRYLEAFEQDRFDLLPASVFSRGFLRQYALYVGLDPDEVLNYFLWAQTEGEPGDGEEDGIAEEPPPKQEGSLIPWLMVAGIVVLLGLILLLVWGFSGDDGDAVGGQAEPFVPPTAAPLPVPPPPPPPAPVEPSVPLRIAVEFVRNCWVEAVVDGGVRRIAQEFAQGESLQIDADRQVIFRRLGNAGGVQIEVNGEPYPLPGEEGELLKDLVLDLEVARALVAPEPGAITAGDGQGEGGP